MTTPNKTGLNNGRSRDLIKGKDSPVQDEITTKEDHINECIQTEAISEDTQKETTCIRELIQEEMNKKGGRYKKEVSQVTSAKQAHSKEPYQVPSKGSMIKEELQNMINNGTTLVPCESTAIASPAIADPIFAIPKKGNGVQ